MVIPAQDDTGSTIAPEDASYGAMRAISRILRRQSGQQFLQGQDMLLADDIEAALDVRMHSVVLSGGGRDVTALDLERRASIFARWALRRGFCAGDRVAVVLSSTADYVAVWIGLSKIGVCACLIPTHFGFGELVESVSSCGVRAVIADPSLAERWYSMAGADGSVQVFALAEDDTEGDIGPGIDSLPDFRPDREHRESLAPDDPALIMFTSGSTGVPRRVTLSQSSAIAMMRSIGRVAGLRSGKRIVSMLPLYHYFGGLCGIGAALHTGATIVLGSRFSVEDFWRTARESSATGFLHSGEMCRCLMAAPSGRHERQHSMTEAIGSGMSSGMATALSKRAGIRKLTEVYASSEALVVMAGSGGRTGAVGKPVAFPQMRPEVRLARFDPVSGMCVRDDTGRCVEVAPGQFGEVLVRSGAVVRQDVSDSVLVDAFEPGDMWHRTADMMRRVGNGGGYRFVGSRTQLWHWREQTVFAQDIEEALLEFAGIAHVCAYGVSVPGQRGLAAMVCVVPSGRSLDLAGLGRHMVSVLPPAAVPGFVRLRSEPLLGAAFFHQRARLIASGYDPSATTDPLYVNNAGVLGRLDEIVYERICSSGSSSV